MRIISSDIITPECLKFVDVHLNFLKRTVENFTDEELSIFNDLYIELRDDYKVIKNTLSPNDLIFICNFLCLVFDQFKSHCQYIIKTLCKAKYSDKISELLSYLYVNYPYKVYDLCCYKDIFYYDTLQSNKIFYLSNDTFAEIIYIDPYTLKCNSTKLRVSFTGNIGILSCLTYQETEDINSNGVVYKLNKPFHLDDCTVIQNTYLKHEPAVETDDYDVRMDQNIPLTVEKDDHESYLNSRLKGFTASQIGVGLIALIICFSIMTFIHILRG